MAHMHYKGTGNMHSFRGRLESDGQDRIRIQGATGEIAWRITKFEILPKNFGTSDYEAVIQVWREEHPAPGGDIPEWNVIDFNDDELLAAACWSSNSNVTTEVSGHHVIFDNTLFVRNIWITLKDTQSGTINYYMELEEVKVSAPGMAQLAVAAARRVSGT